MIQIIQGLNKWHCSCYDKSFQCDTKIEIFVAIKAHLEETKNKIDLELRDIEQQISICSKNSGKVFQLRDTCNISLDYAKKLLYVADNNLERAVEFFKFCDPKHIEFSYEYKKAKELGLI